MQNSIQPSTTNQDYMRDLIPFLIFLFYDKNSLYLDSSIYQTLASLALLPISSVLPITHDILLYTLNQNSEGNTLLDL